MEGRFLRADDVAGLRAQAGSALEAGAGAVFLGESPLGDPIVLAAGLSPAVPDLLLGAQRDMHAAVLYNRDRRFAGLVLDALRRDRDQLFAEAVALCRAMWRDGEATGAGPHFPVEQAVNRPRPPGPGSPLLALDLTGGEEVPAALAGAADLLLQATDDTAVCRVERA